MRYEVKISAQAENDLRGIYLYIARELRSPQNALRQFERLENNIYSLDELPERYRCYEREPWRSRGLRIMVVDNYLVFYIPNKETQTVDIVRVMYGGRDVDAQLNRFTK